MNVFSVIGRKPAPQSNDSNATKIRMSGTTINELPDIELKNPTGPIDAKNPIGRMGNDYYYPDHPRGYSQINTANGDRLQDFANSHLGEGPTPGRIPRFWNNRFTGKIGRCITGSPDGTISESITITGDAAGGTGDMKYFPHTPTPRASMMSRPYMRTVDDSAYVPAVYVADATRR